MNQVTDEHRKLAREVYATHKCGSFDAGLAEFDTLAAAKLLADFERKVRLEEAKWWFEDSINGEGKNVTGRRERIAELSAEPAAATKK